MLNMGYGKTPTPWVSPESRINRVCAYYYYKYSSTVVERFRAGGEKKGGRGDRPIWLPFRL
jgi:hypothetical protein